VVVTFIALSVLHLYMMSALPIYIAKLPDSLQVSNFAHRVLALLKWETSVKPFGIDKLFQLLPFASFSLLSCHRSPLPWLAFLALLSTSTITILSTTLTLTFFYDVTKELLFFIREIDEICPTTIIVG
jgi:hypothetical protein